MYFNAPSINATRHLDVTAGSQKSVVLTSEPDSWHHALQLLLRISRRSQITLKDKLFRKARELHSCTHKAAHKQNSFRHYDYGECRHNIKALDRNKPLRERVKEQCPENWVYNLLRVIHHIWRGRVWFMVCIICGNEHGCLSIKFP